jgi:hypothetical protein
VKVKSSKSLPLLFPDPFLFKKPGLVQPPFLQKTPLSLCLLYFSSCPCLFPALYSFHEKKILILFIVRIFFGRLGDLGVGTGTDEEIRKNLIGEADHVD